MFRGSKSRRVDATKRLQEARKVESGFSFIADAVGAPDVAFDPAVDRPLEGIALGGTASSERLRDLQWDVRSEPRKPFRLDLQVPGPRLDEWQTDVHVRPEQVDRVDRTGGLVPLERKVRPRGELIGEQSADETFVDVDLVRVHLFRAHEDLLV